MQPKERAMRAVPDLHTLQQRFWRLMVAPQGIRAELDDWRSEDPLAAEKAQPEAWIIADSATHAIERLSVYANMYFFRLRDLLADDFPTLQMLIGADRFHNLVTDYLYAFPPCTPSVRDIGQKLADFVAAGHAMTDDWPCASAIARLEWARADAIDRACDPRLELEQLRQLAPEQWATLRLSLRSATTLLALSHAVLPLWRAVEDGADHEALAHIDVAQTTTYALVWRQDERHDFAVCHRALDVREHHALASIAAGGASFAEVCAIAASGGNDDTSAAQQAIEWLQRWITEGLLRRDL
jgi:hypothetical protein